MTEVYEYYGHLYFSVGVGGLLSRGFGYAIHSRVV